MHLSQAVASIQALVGSIKSVQMVYSERQPLSMDVVVDLRQDGIRLVFDPVNHRLKTIQVYDLNMLRLKYR
jgi:hypothetical protein